MTGPAPTPHLTRGCQCGRVRYALHVAPPKIGLCHCRMCQKATAAPFGVFAVVKTADFAWTRGTPSNWRSSSRAIREFCGVCGTPLVFRPLDLDVVEVLAGSLDHPEAAVPTFEVGREAKLPWVNTIAHMPGRTTLENMGAERLSRVVSYQHPDDETPKAKSG